MRYEHTQIFQRSYQLVLNVYRVVGNFKREYKYTLGEKLKDVCHQILDLVVLANVSRDKTEALNQLDRRLETLRIHLRLASDLKTVGLNSIETINLLIEDIGKQLIGWRKWSAKIINKND